MKLKQLLDSGLYIDDYADEDDNIMDNDINRLLYWEDKKLFNLDDDPQEEGERLRNLTLISKFSKIVKKFPDVMVELPPRYEILLNRILRDNLEKKFPNVSGEGNVIELTDQYIVTRSYNIQYTIDTFIHVTPKMIMTELYQSYLDLPVSASWINLFMDSEYNSNVLFRFTVPGTNYRIGFLFNGQIVSIKLESDITAENVIKMSHWANDTLKDIVVTAKVCKEIEEYEEQEPESTIRYQCTR